MPACEKIFFKINIPPNVLFTHKTLLWSENTHTHTKKMETKLISFWIFFFPFPFLQIMIKILRNLSGNIQFKNLQVFCLYCSGVKKIFLSRKKRSHNKSEVLHNWIWHFRTDLYNYNDVFVFSTSINCNTNEHWLLWKMHNIHTI